MEHLAVAVDFEPVETGTVVDEHHFVLAFFLLPSARDHSSSEERRPLLSHWAVP